MPQMGLEVTEGTIAAVHVAPGAVVAAGEVLLELETDKALTEIVAPCAGIVAKIEVEVGDTVPLGATLVVLGQEADEPVPADSGSTEAVSPAASAAASATTAAPSASASPSAAAPRAAAAGPARNAHGRLRAAPVARRAAVRLGVALESVAGTGPRGRITLADVERARASRSGGAEGGRSHAASGTRPNNASGTRLTNARPAPAAEFAELLPLTATRRTIARRMTVSQTIPQFSLEREIDATWLLASKQALPAPSEQAARSGVNDMLAQALGELVVRHPALATSFVEDGSGGPCLGRRDGVDVGLAVATQRGLVVPVLRQTHTRTLAELARERVRLIGAARSGRLVADDLNGASVTISNLGSFGIDRFVAMLNPGEAAILAVGRIVERVLPHGRGIAVIPTLTLSLTIDHRVMDGATGAEALAELAELLEGAMTWRP
jgi:pyruvate dehydrogenase E2 component (dihydrolipoamide acetyltransferase)